MEERLSRTEVVWAGPELLDDYVALLGPVDRGDRNTVGGPADLARRCVPGGARVAPGDGAHDVARLIASNDYPFPAPKRASGPRPPLPLNLRGGAMASIAKRQLARGVAFDVRYRDPNGRARKRTLRRAEDARSFAKTVEAEIVRGDYLRPALARTRFDRWADEWMLSTADLRPETRVGYESMLRVNVLPHFGGWLVSHIETVHVRQYLADLRAAGAGPGTVRSARKILRLVLATAVEGGALRANPCIGIRLARSEPTEMAFLTMDEVLTLASAMRRPEYGLLVRLAALSGLRAGEIGALRVARLDLHRSRVEVAEAVGEVTGHGLVYGPPKTYERRSVPLPSALAEELGAYLADRPHQPQDFVFTAPGGGPLRHHNFYRRHFKPALEAAGLPGTIRFHDLRHTCAALLINATRRPIRWQ